MRGKNNDNYIENNGKLPSERAAHQNETKGMISYKQLGVIIASFVIGLILALLFTNSQSDITTTFKTTELIGFVLTVILSGGSIVLAIAAIALGKTSEQAVINRSDESIRLQTEVFTKTTDALQQIKASTGVTEKRIEDIIAGRAGEISRQLVELANTESSTGKFDITDFEEKIRESIKSALQNDTDPARDEKLEKLRERARKRRELYNKKHDSFLHELGLKLNAKVLKIGHGSPSEMHEPTFDIFDAVYDIGSKKFGISTFIAPAKDGTVYTDCATMFSNVYKAMKEFGIDDYFFVVFEDNFSSEPNLARMEEALENLKDEISDRFTLVLARYSDFNPAIEKIIQNVQEAG